MQLHALQQKQAFGTEHSLRRQPVCARKSLCALRRLFPAEFVQYRGKAFVATLSVQSKVHQKGVLQFFFLFFF
jgi:hypothetical protein